MKILRIQKKIISQFKEGDLTGKTIIKDDAFLKTRSLKFYKFEKKEILISN